MCILARFPDPTSPGVWWQDDNSWVLYGPLASKLILRALAQGLTWLDLSRLSGIELPSDRTYGVDLQKMQQVNLGSRHKREIRIIMLPETKAKCPHCESASFQMGYNMQKEAMRILRNGLHRKLLETVFDKLCTEEAMKSSIQPLVDRPHDIKFRQSLSKCSENGREKFLEAAEAASKQNPSFLDALVIRVMRGEEVEEKIETVRYVFLGAKKGDLETILEQGSVEEYKGRRGFNWLGLRASFSLPYCSGYYPEPGTYRMLVMLVVVNLPEGQSLKGKRGLRVVNTSYMLPVAFVDILVPPTYLFSS